MTSPLTDGDRWMLGFIGVGLIGAGVGMILGRERVMRANARRYNSALGRAGERVAQASKPWVAVMSGVVAIAIGAVLLASVLLSTALPTH